MGGKRILDADVTGIYDTNHVIGDVLLTCWMQFSYDEFMHIDMRRTNFLMLKSD
jgi:hypothetical protein